MAQALSDAPAVHQDVDDSRSRLMQAATELIRAQSYHSVGVKAICDRAGVQRGSFYHHFESKPALVLAALDAEWDRFDGDVLAACRDGFAPARTRLDGFVERLHRRHERDKEAAGQVLGCMFGNLAAESTSLDDGIRHRLAEVFEAWTGALEPPLAEAQAAGEIDDCLSPRELAGQVLAALEGLTLLAKVTNEPDILLTGGRGLIERLWGCPHSESP